MDKKRKFPVRVTIGSADNSLSPGMEFLPVFGSRNSAPVGSIINAPNIPCC